jgi:hypothetical protein
MTKLVSYEYTITDLFPEGFSDGIGGRSALAEVKLANERWRGTAQILAGAFGSHVTAAEARLALARGLRRLADTLELGE